MSYNCDSQLKGHFDLIERDETSFDRIWEPGGIDGREQPLVEPSPGHAIVQLRRLDHHILNRLHYRGRL